MERRRVRGYFFFFPLYNITRSAGVRGLVSPGWGHAVTGTPPPALSPTAGPALAATGLANPESLGCLGGDAAGTERSPVPGAAAPLHPGDAQHPLRPPRCFPPLRRSPSRSPEKLRGRSVSRAEAARVPARSP